MYFLFGLFLYVFHYMHLSNSVPDFFPESLSKSPLLLSTVFCITYLNPEIHFCHVSCAQQEYSFTKILLLQK